MKEKHISQPTIRINPDAVFPLLTALNVSRREIARLAGVHHVTVSKVLRNYRRVSDEKRRAVLDALAVRLGRSKERLVMGRLAA